MPEQTELGKTQTDKRTPPLVQIGEGPHTDDAAMAMEPPMVTLTRIMLNSPSFNAIMTEAMDQALADIKVKISQDLNAAILNNIDFDDIASDVISQADVHDTIVESATSAVQDAMQRAF